MMLGQRQDEPVVARPFVEDRKAPQLRHRRRRLAGLQPAAALRHEKEIAGLEPETGTACAAGTCASLP